MPAKDEHKIFEDPCSLSNPGFYLTTKVSLKWNIDFQRNVIHGQADLLMQFIDNVSNTIILDTRDLTVSKVWDVNGQQDLPFSMGETDPVFGTPLKIDLSQFKTKANFMQLTIDYETSPSAGALQWIDASATMGKKHPYLFSQCQAIHARSIMPCQDTPGVKFTYVASVTCPKDMVALMSACRLEAETSYEGALVTYNFEQKTKIPSYLIAIVCADIVSKKIGPISSVWTERELIDVCAEEFNNVNDMIQAAESLVGPYVWGVYDLLVLPPSFPYGGMENPCLTFVTPTLIAKDKSLTNVIGHEIAHSWTGNLVTNCNWENFWLNEGFTVFLERKIDGIMKKSEQFRQFECIDGWRILQKEVDNFGATNQLTNLRPCLKGVDPDESFSSIPYEKGHMFLYYLEELLGGVEIFNKYLRAHIDKFTGTSISTDEWKAFLYEYFSDKKELLDKVDWKGWLDTPGMPPVTLKFDRTLADEVTQFAQRLINDKVESVDPLWLKFETQQKTELLSQLFEASLSADKVQTLSDVYQMGNTENSEILMKWISLGIKARWSPIIPKALKFVTDQGRMKFTRPTYRELGKWDEAREQAIETFKRNKPFMHSTTAGLVERLDLQLTK